MNDWDSPLLVALAAAPGTALLALASAIFIWKRKIGAVSAGWNKSAGQPGGRPDFLHSSVWDCGPARGVA